MPTSRRQPIQSEKREALLDAAITLFRRNGVADTTVEEITQHAGVAKGTFYLYFDSRDDLLDQLRVEFAQQMESFFAGAVPPADPAAWPRFIAALVEAAVDRLVDEKELHDLIVALPHSHEAGPLADAVLRAHQALGELLRAGNGLGALDVADVDATAWLMFDFIHAAGDRASLSPGAHTRFRRAAATAVERWLLPQR